MNEKTLPCLDGPLGSFFFFSPSVFSMYGLSTVMHLATYLTTTKTCGGSRRMEGRPSVFPFVERGNNASFFFLKIFYLFSA